MERIKMYIDGVWTDSQSGKYREIINPANGQKAAEAVEGTAEDARKAIAAAQKAFAPGSPWRQLLPEERAALLNRAADLVEERAEELAVAETNSMGRVYKETRYDDVYAVSDSFRYYAGLIHELQGKASAGNGDMVTMTLREPLGVKAMEDAGFPAGSVNLVLGPGEEIGAALAESEDVDKIILTGSTETGKKIIEKSAASLKRYAMELGGKSPFIIFDDADLDAAVDRLMFGIFLSQGQVCIAGSRLLVQDTAYEKVISMLKERIPKIRIGMPLEEDTEFGPMVSEHHMERVLEYIRIGREEGAEVLIGGNRIEEGDFAKGCFVEPTVFVNCTEDMRIVKEEIFGPVLTVQTFTDEEEAVRLANSTRYGLAGAVFTGDMGRALRVCSRVNTGIIWANTFMEDTPGMAISPHRQSGMSIDGGLDGLQEYTVLKQINLKMNPQRTGWFSAVEADTQEV